jgi:hypothetical protein
MENFEKLGVFYLGKEYDLEEKKLKENLLLYDSKDLTTHAVCVGMTGSGKTGLCIGILEEAAMDGIPSVVIDPKGDLSNLLLTFPDLAPEDFRPWINEDDARKKDLTPDEFAAGQASLWKKGLGKWGQDGERIRKLRDSAEFTVYTPGSSAGLQVSILKSFDAPPQAIIDDTDLLRERVVTTVTSILNLIGVEADPIQSREHILLSTIMDALWRRGQGLDLARLIQAIQSPPVDRIGVFDLESFFPSKDRHKLAMKINNLLAAPGFQSWLEGDPLDMDRMFYTGEGKPKVTIFSIAHLEDAERMFFVSLLLTQLLGWARTQSGTNSLRALFYMDEIFGYFPPVANPPSKAPLLTLLKQARAYGLGIILATQNPVDLDYKGLSNTGTWFLGRLQTERDKARVLDGLEGVRSSSGGRFDRKSLERILTSLGKRVFLMNNVHEDEPVIFNTRWVMSYLRGPLTRNQIKQLMDPVKALRPAPAEGEGAPGERSAPEGSTKPVLPPKVPEFFLPLKPEMVGEDIVYEPMVLGLAKLYFANAKAGVAAERGISLLADSAGAVDWREAEETTITEEDLEKVSEEEAVYGDLPPAAARAASYTAWGRELKDWIYRNHTLELLKSPSLGIISAHGEEERDFRIRLGQSAREKRDKMIEKLRKGRASKIATLEQQVLRGEQAVDREKEQASQQKMQTMISLGTTILSTMFGRKKISSSTVGKAATTASKAGRIFKESGDIKRAQEKLADLKERLKELHEGLAAEVEQIRTSIDPLTEELETVVIRPRKMDISVQMTALAWAPYVQSGTGRITRAW